MISVVLPTHRDDTYIWQAIKSVLAQEGIEFELVIVANNCALDYIDRLQALTSSRIKLIITKIPQIAFSLNLGLDQAKFDLIARMDSDDLMKPNRLKEQYNFFIANPETSILGSQVEHISSTGKILGKSNYPTENTAIRSKLIYKATLCHPSVMYRKEIVIKSGGYSGGLLSEDYDLWLRLLENDKVVFRNYDSILLSYRKHSQATQGSPRAYAEVAGHFLKMFLLYRRIKYVTGLVVSVAKAFKRGNRVK